MRDLRGTGLRGLRHVFEQSASLFARPSLHQRVAMALYATLLGFAILTAKIVAFMVFFVWIRWTFPRFRFDQLLRLGWKVLLPLAIANLVGVAALTIAGVL